MNFLGRYQRISICFLIIIILLIITIHAVCDAQIIITYNPNGGNFDMTQQSQQIHTGFITKDLPTRDRYSFLGWALDEYATAPEFLPGEEYHATEDHELYAVWQETVDWGILAVPCSKEASFNIVKNKYYFKFSVAETECYCFTCSNQAFDDKELDVQLFSYSSNYSDYSVIDVYNSFTFSNNVTSIVWELEAGREYYFRCMLDYALNNNSSFHFDVSISPVVVYDVGNGSYSYNMPHYQAIDENQRATITEYTPEWNNHTFVGWSSIENATVPEFFPNQTYTFSEATTIFAIWKEATDLGVLDTELSAFLEFDIKRNNYYSKFTANKDGYYDFTINCSDIYCQSDIAMTTPLDSQHSHAEYLYFYGGNYSVTWHVEAGREYSFCFTPSWLFGNYVNFEIFIKEVPVIFYDANGGSIFSPMTVQQKINDDGSVVLQSGMPSRTNFTFIGWSENPDSITSSYLPGDTYWGTPNTTLYAVWQERINLGTLSVPYSFQYCFPLEGNNTYFSFSVPVAGNYVFKIISPGYWRLDSQVTWPVVPPDESYVYSHNAFPQWDDAQFIWPLESETTYTLELQYYWGLDKSYPFNPTIFIYCDSSQKNTPDAVLPDNLEIIEEESFSHTNLKYAYINDSQNEISIRKGAFSYCNHLILLRLPANVHNIDPDAFEGTNVTLIVQRGSYAEIWADNNKIPFFYEE